jgi:hypothetical protein
MPVGCQEKWIYGIHFYFRRVLFRTYVRIHTHTLFLVEIVEWVPGWIAGDANADRYSFYVSIESQRDLILSLAHLSLW